MKNILVTGGAGFIGTHLITKLKKKYPDAEIISIDNYFTGKHENHVEGVKYVRSHTQYINTAVLPTIWKPDVVYHLGEYSRIVKSFDDINVCFESNIIGTQKVLEYCRAKGAKLIYAASSSKFGNDGADEHLSPYAWMKAKNVELIKNYSDWFGLDYAITYFYNVYGPNQITEGDYATVIGIFQKQYLEGKPITVVSPGTQKRDFTHVEDIVDGILLVSEKGDGDGYLLGTGTNYTLMEVAKFFGTTQELIPARTGERFTSKAYKSKAQDIGFKPKHKLPKYIKDFVKNNKPKTD